jgi:hypothetical protein
MELTRIAEIARSASFDAPTRPLLGGREGIGAVRAPVEIAESAP